MDVHADFQGTWKTQASIKPAFSGSETQSGKKKEGSGSRRGCEVPGSPRAGSTAAGWGSQVHRWGLLHNWGSAFAKRGEQPFLQGSQQVWG